MKQSLPEIPHIKGVTNDSPDDTWKRTTITKELLRYGEVSYWGFIVYGLFYQNAGRPVLEKNGYRRKTLDDVGV